MMVDICLTPEWSAEERSCPRCGLMGRKADRSTHRCCSLRDLHLGIEESLNNVGCWCIHSQCFCGAVRANGWVWWCVGQERKSDASVGLSKGQDLGFLFIYFSDTSGWVMQWVLTWVGLRRVMWWAVDIQWVFCIWVVGCFGLQKNRILIWLFGTNGDIGIKTSRWWFENWNRRWGTMGFGGVALRDLCMVYRIT